MIRSELVARIAEQNPHLHARDVEAVVDTILDRIGQALVDGNRVELRGFGTFEPRRREARSGRNPRTQAEVNVAARTTVQFRPAKAVHDRLNRVKIDPDQEAERILRAS